MNRLLELRKKADETGDSMSKKTGYSRTSIYRWEEGINYPTLPAARDLANFFNTTVDDIWPLN